MKIIFCPKNVPNADWKTLEVCHWLISKSCVKCELLITIKGMNSIFKSIGVKIVSQGEFKTEEISWSEFLFSHFESNYCFCTNNAGELQRIVAV